MLDFAFFFSTLSDSHLFYDVCYIRKIIISSVRHCNYYKTIERTRIAIIKK